MRGDGAEAGAFQGAEAQEEDAEKIPEKTLFLICTTAMYGMRKNEYG
ncbi:MAG: hypothetical protein KJ886_02485 [Candidatus Thermoplasmatota archaeon]|nr:hypothetical protein [Candidatus Thermoplasmatota archaeon]MCG2825445.1 hypothetical protein [Thermoplasmatales archaeon]